MKRTDKKERNAHATRLVGYLEKRVRDIALTRFGTNEKLHLSKAFAEWYSGVAYKDPGEYLSLDGCGDGKVDGYFSYRRGSEARYAVLNVKYSTSPGALIQQAHYDEIREFFAPFRSKKLRKRLLSDRKPTLEVRRHLEKLCGDFDKGIVDLLFITTAKHDRRVSRAKRIGPVRIIDFDDVAHLLAEDIDGAAPITEPISFNGVHQLLRPTTTHSKVETAVCFVKIYDFVRYLRDDPLDLLFARNVRVAISAKWRAGTSSKQIANNLNAEIADTYENNPSEFAFSNNGITMICDEYMLRNGVLTATNPRVVNGLQSLSAVRNLRERRAYVMLRIIRVPQVNARKENSDSRKLLVDKIAQRTNSQNPVKVWSLRSNDDYQMSIYRVYRSIGIHYDRKIGEFNQNVRLGRSRGLALGPNITQLAQAIASSGYARDLGPGIAKTGKKKLFSDPVYTQITKVSDSTALLLGLLFIIVQSQLARTTGKLSLALARNANLFVYRLIVDGMKGAGFRFDKRLERYLIDLVVGSKKGNRDSHFCALVNAALTQARGAYLSKRKQAGFQDLSLNNFFKNETYLADVISGRRHPGRKVINAARELKAHGFG